MSRYKVIKEVVSKSYSLGVCDGSSIAITKKINSMILNSARITHPKGSRRFEDFIFKIDNRTVLDIHLIKCIYCLDRKKLKVYNECPHCEGKGCTSCLNGLRPGTIPCQSCK